MFKSPKRSGSHNLSLLQTGYVRADTYPAFFDTLTGAVRKEKTGAESHAN